MANAVLQGVCLCEADMSGTVLDGAVFSAGQPDRVSAGASEACVVSGPSRPTYYDLVGPLRLRAAVKSGFFR